MVPWGSRAGGTEEGQSRWSPRGIWRFLMSPIRRALPRRIQCQEVVGEPLRSTRLLPSTQSQGLTCPASNPCLSPPSCPAPCSPPGPLVPKRSDHISRHRPPSPLLCSLMARRQAGKQVWAACSTHTSPDRRLLVGPPSEPWKFRASQVLL